MTVVATIAAEKHSAPILMPPCINSDPLRLGRSPLITGAQPPSLWAPTPMITLFTLLAVLLLVSLGHLSMLAVDLSAFPGGLAGVLVLLVVVLLLTRRI